MLEIEKIKYTKKAYDMHPNCVQVTGSLLIYAGVTIDKDAQVPDDVIRREISERIWRTAYAELYKPFMELQKHAMRSCHPQHYEKIRELCNEIGALLKHPNQALQ